MSDGTSASRHRHTDQRNWGPEVRIAIIGATATILATLLTVTANSYIAYQSKRLDFEVEKLKSDNQNRSYVLQRTMESPNDDDNLRRIIEATSLGLIPDPTGIIRRGAEEYREATNPNQKPARPVQKPAAYLPSSSTFRIVLPVQGRLIDPFGTTKDGTRNDGINIAVPLDTPVHAAASGMVSYAGNELRQFGNLVLIRHGDGYVTAYAHLDKVLVLRGDTVKESQVIGTVGQTGDVSEPQLHFELRRDTDPVDPQNFFRSRRQPS